MLRVPKIGGEPKSETSAAAMEAASAPVSTGPVKIKLREVLRTHNGMVNEITLRQPRAADYIEIGRVPFDVRGEQADRRAVVDFKCMAQWVSRLSGLDEIIVGTLGARDWLDISGSVNAILMQAGLEALGGTVGNSEGSAAT